jgi:hypothetical protein
VTVVLRVTVAVVHVVDVIFVGDHLVAASLAVLMVVLVMGGVVGMFRIHAHGEVLSAEWLTASRTM